ncbi:IS66 family insertion sequence element accessory protein TnpB [Xylocopilactobacillus apicola]|uniref:Transposase n=1 Tax=Xylocopilactobacillus apicola TaxID=2932184 RepID=A0AAU9D3Y9_9LACO|nr:IS66 family insertion sequence element accessory protein TnpB [Xylocopilactobacillus apicola]BDR58183.1 transposase [Xylocopilactobacillus apicola]
MNRLINFQALKAIYLICGKTDLRKSIDGLAAIVHDQFELDPFQPQLFLFCGTKRDRFKALYHEHDGFVLLYKRIDRGRFQWPNEPEELLKLDQKQLADLLNGFGIISTIKKSEPGYFY